MVKYNIFITLYPTQYVNKIYDLLYYDKIQQIPIQENETSIMAKAIDKRIPEEIFVQLLAKKAHIIKDHL